MAVPVMTRQPNDVEVLASVEEQASPAQQRNIITRMQTGAIAVSNSLLVLICFQSKLCSLPCSLSGHPLWLLSLGERGLNTLLAPGP